MRGDWKIVLRQVEIHKEENKIQFLYLKTFYFIFCNKYLCALILSLGVLV